MPKRVIGDSPLRRALSSTDPTQVRSYVDAVLIPMGRLRPDPRQPRRAMDGEALAELADSIRQRGVLQPVLVREDGDDFVIIAGHRRYQAARMAGLEAIPCVVRDTSGPEAQEEALVENLQRADLDPLEEALALRRLLDEHGYTIRRLAERVHKSVGYVHARLELAQRPDLAEAVQTLNIGLYAARELAKLDEAQRRELVRRVAAGELDDQGLVQAAREMRSGPAQPTSAVTPRIPWTALRRALDRLDPPSLTPSQRSRARRELVGLRDRIERLLQDLDS